MNGSLTYEQTTQSDDVKPGYGIDQFGTWSSERNKNPVGKEGLPG